MSKVSRLKRLEEKIKAREQQKSLEEMQQHHQHLVNEHLKSPGHKKPTTRREFLEAGVISLAGYVLGPSIFSILSTLSPEAIAQALPTCPSPAVGSGTGPAPFINFHLEGGFQTLAIATPRGYTSGERISNYSRLGLGQAPTFATNAFPNSIIDMPNRGAGSNSGFYQGIMSVASAATRSNTSWVTVTYRDNGDSGDPQFSMLGQVASLGRIGSKTGFLRGDGGDGPTGISGKAAFNILSSPTPVRISNTISFQNSIQAVGALAQLSQDQQLKVARTIQSLNLEQAASIAGVNGGQKLNDLIYCATDQNINKLQGGGADINPRTAFNGQLAQLFNNFANANSPGSNDAFSMEAIATMVLNTVNGNSAGCAINIGGFDIHNNANRVLQEAAMFQFGRVVGASLETARLAGSKVFIHISTNGSNNNQGGTADSAFDSDTSDYSGAHFLMYDPAGPVPVSGTQIGGLIESGNSLGKVNTETPIGSQVEDGVAAVYLNYVAFSGLQEIDFDRTIGKNFSSSQKAYMRKKV